MIKSMTGYGKYNLTKDLRDYQMEIRSVNHKYLDVSVKLPRLLSYLEEDIKKIVTMKLTRGKVEVYLNFDNSSTEGKDVGINTEMAKLYIKELKKLAEEERISSNIEVTEIIKLPDVLKIQKNTDEELIKNEILEVTTNAVENLIMMRKIEGNQIENDLFARMITINSKIQTINALSAGLIKDYVVKLEGRLKELTKNQEIDESRLAQEVVIYADKCSVAEEITRLNSHIIQFSELIKESNIAIGKKLDFIIQEMNREINTIGSKANNLDITKNVIDIKTELENIREQIQNVE